MTPISTPLDSTLLDSEEYHSAKYHSKLFTSPSATSSISPILQTLETEQLVSEQNTAEHFVYAGVQHSDLQHATPQFTNLEPTAIPSSPAQPNLNQINPTLWLPSIHPRCAGSELHTWSAFPLPLLERDAEIVVYLPADYHSSHRRYSVLYIQDGKNIFSSSQPYVHSWNADQIADIYSPYQLPIIVAISNAGDHRSRSLEYCPFDDAILGNSRSQLYLESILNTIKPHIDAQFRTYTDAAHTGILGAGLGGLFSLYVGLNFPEHFGFAAAVSPDLWRWALSLRAKLLKQRPHLKQHFYMDIGTAEQDSMTSTAERLKISRTFHRFLMRRGYAVDYQEIDQGIHNEVSWRLRLPKILLLFHQFSHQFSHALERESAGIG